jgi:hypothetical protein
MAGQQSLVQGVVDSMALFEEKSNEGSVGSFTNRWPLGSSLRPEHRVEHECLFVPNLIPNDCELLILLA